MTRPEIMTVQEVADYLRVSERTVYEWASNGTIPAGKLGTTWRFKRSEVDKWVDENLGGGRPTPTFAPITLRSILKREHTLILDTASKETSLRTMMDAVGDDPAVQDADEAMEGIFRRETMMSTGIGLGIGIPHVRLESIKSLVMIAAVDRQAITDYESLDGQPVRILFMILAGRFQHNEHIKTMAAISTKFKNPMLREQLLAAADAESVYEILTRGD